MHLLVLAMAAAAGCDAFELYERVCGLVASVLEPAVGEVSAVRPSTRAGRQRLVARAREALLSDPSVGLVVLARAAGSDSRFDPIQGLGHGQRVDADAEDGYLPNRNRGLHVIGL